MGGDDYVGNDHLCWFGLCSDQDAHLGHQGRLEHPEISLQCGCLAGDCCRTASGRAVLLGLCAGNPYGYNGHDRREVCSIVNKYSHDVKTT